MLSGAKMVLCVLAGLSASLRSAANLPAAAHKTSFLLLITYYTIILFVTYVFDQQIVWWRIVFYIYPGFSLSPSTFISFKHNIILNDKHHPQFFFVPSACRDGGNCNLKF
jgi:hypothetical protein